LSERAWWSGVGFDMCFERCVTPGLSTVVADYVRWIGRIPLDAPSSMALRKARSRFG